VRCRGSNRSVTTAGQRASIEAQAVDSAGLAEPSPGAQPPSVPPDLASALLVTVVESSHDATACKNLYDTVTSINLSA
jgi:hypothetical protein